MASFTFCNDSSQRQILHRIENLMVFIQQTQWIIEAYVSDFYTRKHWQKLNSCVQEFVDASGPPDWAWLLAEDATECPKPTRVVPLSLLALKSCSQYLSLERTAMNLHQADSIQYITQVLQNDASSGMTCQNEPASASNTDGGSAKFKAAPFEKPNYKNGQCMDMQHIFRKHVKPKKQHEILQFGKAIQMVSQMTHCKSVIDVGAGLGHLSRLLTFLHGLQVTTVEETIGHAPKATEFDRQLKKDMLKKLKKDTPIVFSDQMIRLAKSPDIIQTDASTSLVDHQNQKTTADTSENANNPHPETSQKETVLYEEGPLPSHVVCRIQPDIAASQFVDIVRMTKSQGLSDDNSEQNESANEDEFILAGLHACGDLTPTLLKIFAQCPSAVGLASVGCCYMKMDECFKDERGLIVSNYPMSTFLKSQTDLNLNYESREMACHFADVYCQRLKENPVHLKIHSYRAALQYLIETVSPGFASGQNRLVCKKGAEISFTQYASEVLKKLQIDIKTVPEELLQECEQMTSSWKRVVAFYTIRLSIAPAVESLILLDRMLFLKELGMNCALVPIFDSRLSPRNFALLAVKS